jgi:hypothetical protein
MLQAELLLACLLPTHMSVVVVIPKRWYIFVSVVATVQKYKTPSTFFNSANPKSCAVASNNGQNCRDKDPYT